MITETITLWRDEEYDGKVKDFKPTLKTHIHDDDCTRGAVLVIPGGGYGFVAPIEGEPIAMMFFSNSYNVFVLNYSVAPNMHPQPLRDVTRAMCIIRENAVNWHIDPDKIAVCGFSAGGHLAGSISVHYNKEYLQTVPGMSPGKNKPNASILCYPVITSGENSHQGSFINLLGEDASKEQLDEMSLEKQVNENTPPTFLWHTFNDDCVPVENSLLYANALRKNNVPFEFHIFPDGPHGLSLANKETANAYRNAQCNIPHIASWAKLCVEWLDITLGL